MANFTQLTLKITDRWGGTYVDLAEIQLLDAAGATIDLTGTTATASSTHSDWVAGRTIDSGIGYIVSSWSSEYITSSTLPATLIYVFPTAIPIAVVRLVNALDGDRDESIRSGTLTALDSSGVEWVASFTNRERLSSYVDSNTNQEVRVYSEHILVSTAPPPTSTPPTLSAIPAQTGTQNQAYSLNLATYATATEGDAITYALSGALPAGLSFVPSTGVLSGTPTASGTFNLSATASDKDGNSTPRSFTLTIAAAQPPVPSQDTLEALLVDVITEIAHDFKAATSAIQSEATARAGADTGLQTQLDALLSEINAIKTRLDNGGL